MHWLSVGHRVVFKIAGLVHQSLVGAALRTLLAIVVFCRRTVVAHCGPIQMTYGSCLYCEHTINSAIGVSRPLVLRCGTYDRIFCPDYDGLDSPLIPSISENVSLWRLKRLVTPEL